MSEELLQKLLLLRRIVSNFLCDWSRMFVFRQVRSPCTRGYRSWLRYCLWIAAW